MADLSWAHRNLDRLRAAPTITSDPVYLAAVAAEINDRPPASAAQFLARPG